MHLLQIRVGLYGFSLSLHSQTLMCTKPGLTALLVIFLMLDVYERNEAYREPLLHLSDGLDPTDDLDLWPPDDNGNGNDDGQHRSWMYHDDPFVDTAVHIASSPLTNGPLPRSRPTPSTASDHEESDD